MTWELEFNGVPPGPNSRMHWRAKAASTKMWRHMAMWKATDAKIPPQERVRLSATIRRARLGVADASNDAARFKAVEDGIVDAGVVPNDTRKYVEWGPILEEHGAPGFVLRIEPLAPVR